MKVYRCISYEELISYNNNEIYHSELKSFGINTFSYEKDIEYIHFFYYPESCEIYLKNKPYLQTNIMICDIPKRILKKYIGYGFYSQVVPDYTIPILEFAIPLEEFNLKYIKKIISNEEIELYLNGVKFDNYLRNLPIEYCSMDMYGFKKGYNKYSVLNMKKIDKSLKLKKERKNEK